MIWVARAGLTCVTSIFCICICICIWGGFCRVLCFCTSVPAVSWGQYRLVTQLKPRLANPAGADTTDPLCQSIEPLGGSRGQRQNVVPRLPPPEEVVGPVVMAAVPGPSGPPQSSNIHQSLEARVSACQPWCSAHALCVTANQNSCSQVDSQLAYRADGACSASMCMGDTP